jgi:tetratricopeptide (TPR) repeat protein
MRAPTALAALIVVVLVAHGVTLFGEFVYDDRFIIVKNEYLGDPAQWGRFFTEGAWAGAGFENTNYRPLPMLTLAANHAMGGLHPFGYHLVNLLLQICNTLLLFALGRRLALSIPAAWFAAALFAVHPMLTEPLAEIVGRMDLMAGGALLGGLLCHINGRLRESSATGSGRWLSVAVLLYGVALLSKEHVVVYPALALVYDLLWGGWRPIRRLGVYLAYAAVAIGYLVLRQGLFGGLLHGGGLSILDNPLAHEGAIVRIVSALWVWGLYLKHLLLPVGLSPDYSYAQVLPFDSATTPGALATWGVSAAAVAAAVFLTLRSRRAALAIALAVLPFLPVSNLMFPIGTVMGERLFYLPVAGFALLAGLGWERVASRNRRLGFGVAGLILMVLVVLTVRQGLRWRNDFTLNSYAVRVAPRSARIKNNLGHDLLERGDLDGAAEQLLEADSIYPDWYLTVSGLAKVALARGDLTEALAQANHAVGIDPESVEALALIAEIHRQRGDLTAAGRAWEELLVHDPDNPSALSNLAILTWNEGHRERGIDLWERAARQPDTASGVWFNLGRAYDQLGRSSEALEAYRRFLSTNPSDAGVRAEAEIRVRALETNR